MKRFVAELWKSLDMEENWFVNKVGTNTDKISNSMHITTMKIFILCNRVKAVRFDSKNIWCTKEMKLAAKPTCTNHRFLKPVEYPKYATLHVHITDINRFDIKILYPLLFLTVVIIWSKSCPQGQLEHFLPLKLEKLLSTCPWTNQKMDQSWSIYISGIIKYY